MPVVFVCSNCGRAIKVYVKHNSNGVPTLENVLQYYECPYCHATLIPDLDLVDVEAFAWNPKLIKKIVEGKLGPEERKKLESTRKGRKVLKSVFALKKLLDEYELVRKSSRINSMINNSKKVYKNKLKDLGSGSGRF